MFNKVKKNKILHITFIVTFIFTTLLVWVVIKRNAYINELKKQVKNIITMSNNHGYDISYDGLSFSYLPFSKIMEANNVTLYTKDFEWNVGELILRNNLFNYNRINILLGKEQHLAIFDRKFDIKNYRANVLVKKDNQGIENIKFKFIGIDIYKTLIAESFEIDLNKSVNDASFSKNTVNIQNIKISDYVEIPLLRTIDKISFGFNTVGARNKVDDAENIINSWKQKGFMTEINKLAIRWEPLVMVGKGEAYFDESQHFNVKIKSTSKGMLETLSMLNNEEKLDSSSFFVLKLMLENKSYKLDPKDKYDTATTKIHLNDGTVLIDNVQIFKGSKQ